MLPDFLFSPKTILFMAITIGYLAARKYADYKSAVSVFTTDEERLMQMAEQRQTSEYEIFRVAAANWNVSVFRIDDDFKDYLLEGILPHYVRDYIRRVNRKNIPCPEA